MECFKLTGLTALITGAGTGIGRATALLFAGAGANLVAAARNRSEIEAVAAQCREFSAGAIAVPTDITQPAQLDHLIETTAMQFGGIDIVINNAGLTNMTRSLATEYATKIRFNVLEVGATLTDALKPLLEHGTLGQQMAGKTPMKHLGSAQDIVRCARYLCSPAGSWVTGKAMEVDGGQLTTNWPMPMNYFERLAQVP